VIIGHQQILDFFKKATQNNTLSHAYCFSGVSKIGKKTVAKKIASDLLEIDHEKLKTSPDYFYLTRELDKKTGKLKKDLSVDQIRELRNRVQTMSWIDGYKIVVIDEAESLSKAGSNALLKILEEPGKKTIFFLITEHEDLLLATIKSRCQNFYLSVLSDKELEKGLISRNYREEKIKEVLRYANGKAGLAIELLEDEELFNNLKKTVQDCNSLISLPIYERFAFLDKYLGGKKDTAMGKEELKKDLDAWILETRRIILEKVKSLSADRQEDESGKIKQLRKLLDKMQEAKKLVLQNINPKLLIENLFLN